VIAAAALAAVGCGSRNSHSVVVTARAGTEGEAELPSATVPTGPEVCFNARDDNRNGLFDEGCGLELGLVQFVAAWSGPRADVDLRVTDPNGELIEVGRVARSGLTKDRDCPGRSGECQGRNLENVYLADGEPQKGQYRVRVRLESLGGESPPIVVMLGARLGHQAKSFELSLDAPQAERELALRM
jgi:tRNA (guanosine-2'-O-)-methyltransferase